MKKKIRQELDYSCGAFALLNCLQVLGFSATEQNIRELCNTSPKGTDENGIIKCIEKYKLGYRIVYSINPECFIGKLLYPAVVLTDNTEHWIACLKKYKRKFHIIDSLYQEVEKEIPKKEFLALAKNLERDTGKIYYYAISLINPTN